MARLNRLTKLKPFAPIVGMTWMLLNLRLTHALTAGSH
jgi:hypothetical protein